MTEIRVYTGFPLDLTESRHNYPPLCVYTLIKTLVFNYKFISFLVYVQD